MRSQVVRPLASDQPQSVASKPCWRPSLLILSVTVLGLLASKQGYGSEPAPNQSALRNWNAGVELWLTSPSFSGDQGFLQTEEDLQANTRIREFQFDYDTTATPRFWVEYQSAYDIGIQASAWFLDSNSDRITLNPPANGFGEITTPPLFGIDLSSVIPGDQLDAQSALEITSFNFEITRRAEFTAWQLEISAGVRHTRIEQSKSWTHRNSLGDLAGTGTWNQEHLGWGPTIQIASNRPIHTQMGILEASLRTSLLRMDEEITILGQEDLDLPTTFATDIFTESSHWSPMIEARLGASWTLHALSMPCWAIGCGYETQWFADVGTPADPRADLGVHGVFFNLNRKW